MPDYVHGGTVAADSLYNGLMLCFDIAALVWVRRSPRPQACFTALTASFLIAVLVAILITCSTSQSPYAGARLLAWGLFLHGPGLALAFSAILFRDLRRWSLLFAAAAATTLAVGGYAFFVEPTWLEVTRVEIVSTKVSQPILIAVVADLQTDRFGEYERRTLRRVMAERPDMILLAGDYLQCESVAAQQRLRTELREFLQEIQLSARLGVFAVQGNVDPPDWTEMFAGLPITAIQETDSREVDELMVTSLSCRDSFSACAEVPATDRFHIVMGHAPNFALQTQGGDLLLAGHTHGGQVRLPWIGPLLTASRVPRPWAAGCTELADDRKLIVSRGVGHERGAAPRLRFLCRPELVMITIRPSDESKNSNEMTKNDRPRVKP